MGGIKTSILPAIKPLSWLLIGLIAANYVYFAFAANPNIIQGDQWLWVKEVLKPLRTGSRSVFEALTYEYDTLSHSHILTLIIFWINERLFGLNMYLDTVIGALSAGGTFYIFYRYICESIGKLEGLFPALIFMLIASLLFNILPANTLSWSLVTFEYLYIFIAVAYLYAFDKWFLNRRYVPFFIFTVFVFLFGDAVGVSALLVSLAITAYLTLTRQVPIKMALTYLALFAALYFLTSNLITGGRIRWFSHTWEFILRSPPDSAMMFLKGVGRGIYYLPLKLDTSGNYASTYVTLLGAFGTISAIGLALYCMVTGKARKYVFPLSLMAFTFVCTFGAVKTRIYAGKIDLIMGERYYRYQIMILIGLALLLMRLVHDNKQKRNLIPKTIIVTSLMVTLGTSVSLLGYSYNKVLPSLGKYFDRIVVNLEKYAVDPSQKDFEKYRTCRDGNCLEAVDYLTEHKLSVFKGD